MADAEFVVVYDISCSKERRHIDRLLKGFGLRVQKSVFECRMRKRDISDLLKRLESINIKTGFVKIYRLEYSSKNPVVGVAPERTDETPNAFIV
ncbi:MAG: CRISPR-associated endonuclease Cas2 [Spirochaetaceae bacterium]|nr:CRISPR-associated endonuclease Cas2 [Spirochaetaceae bacterium]